VGDFGAIHLQKLMSAASAEGLNLDALAGFLVLDA
jgi:hypothetical protein